MAAEGQERTERRQRPVHVIADAEGFPVGTHRVVQVDGREIGVFNVGGEYHALPNLCPHQLGPLCTGRVSGTLAARQDTDWRRQWILDGEIVTCPWHGLEYHIPTGQCLALPEIRLRRYEVWVEEGQVKIRV
jgi:nitrite reductase/ring-hydroxylating ferredoxin subunit